jgi:thiol-disulfide isomerase/thioredoxin
MRGITAAHAAVMQRNRRVLTMIGIGVCALAALGWGWDWEQSGALVSLPVEGVMPSLDGATGWVNSPPGTAHELRGKVVVVQFWTYSCINWLRTLPYVRAWAARYEDKGLVVIGVHSPEFSFEGEPANVRRAIAAMAIGYPVALDSDHSIWRAFHNAYWPALYIVDARGQIRYHHFGEGDYETAELVVRQLLGESPAPPVSVEASGVEAAADTSLLASPETYIGYERTRGFSSQSTMLRDLPREYSPPTDLRLDRWALAGTWTVGGEAAALDVAGGKIVYRFHGRDVHVVMGSKDGHSPIRFRVRIDGAPPGNAHGVDVDERGDGIAIEPRLYQVIRQPSVRERTIEIELLDPGIAIYSFTFG